MAFRRAGLAVTATLLSACTASSALEGEQRQDATVTATAPAVTVTVTQSTAVSATLAGELLEQLVVREWDNAAGYGRSEFGQAWSDDVGLPSGHNGCDQRNDVLRRDLRGITVKAGTGGCVVLSGVLTDPYTGAQIAFKRGANPQIVQIDHVVSLSNAWVTGAQSLDVQERRNLAGDPLNLWAVSSHMNEAKRDSDAADWLPELVSAHCAYVARQIAVKARYRLWVTPSEKHAMSVTLASCPPDDVPSTDFIDPPSLHP